jgi:ABC-type sugar transport system ATPase subunit
LLPTLDYGWMLSRPQVNRAERAPLLPGPQAICGLHSRQIAAADKNRFPSRHHVRINYCCRDQEGRVPVSQGLRGSPGSSLYGASREIKVEALLAQVGLGGLGDKYPWELSGGMQQRASLCRALIHEPQLLMLDEPFAALDSFTREELWCVIRDLHAARPVTIILVTHDLREAAFLADRVFCLSGRPGRVIAERRVPFARLRNLEITYTVEFTDLVHDLRSQIATARQAE